MMTEEQIRKEIEKRIDELREDFARYAVNNEHNLNGLEAFQEWGFSKIACLEVIEENSQERQTEVLVKLAILEKNIDSIIAECGKLTECLNAFGAYLGNYIKQQEPDTQTNAVPAEVTSPPISEGAIKALDRPENYAQLSPEEQWEIDKRLGILDWDGK
jgi:hypothetical protein